MLKIKYLIFSFTVFILTMVSCESDFKTDILDRGRKIVINGYLSADEPIKIQLYESKYIFDPRINNVPLKNPDVQLWLDNQYKENLHPDTIYNSVIDSFTYLTESKPEPGRVYTIKVKCDSFPEASASVKVPVPVNITSIDVIHDYNETFFNQLYSINFKDPPGKNFYFIKFYVTVITMSLDCDSILIQHDVSFPQDYLYYENFVFSDKLFNGINARASFTLPSSWDDKHQHGYWPCNFADDLDITVSRKMYIKLFTCSEEFYRYYTSYRNYVERKDELFYEPVQIYSNVSNGYGILAAYSSFTDSSFSIPVRSHMIGY